MAAESRLFEEPSGELVIAHLYYILETQSTSTFMPRRQPVALVAVSCPRPRV